MKNTSSYKKRKEQQKNKSQAAKGLKKDPDGFVNKRNPKRYQAFFVVLLLFLLFVGGVYWFFWNKTHDATTHITSVSIKNVKHLDHGAIESSVELFLNGTWFLLPKKSRLIARESLIKEHIQREFLTLKNVDVSFKNKTMIIAAIERSPLFTSCNHIFDGHSCFYIDNEGFIYQAAPVFSKGVYLRLHKPGDYNIGGHLVSTSEVSGLQYIASQLRKQNINPWAVVWNDRSVDVYIESVDQQHLGRYAHIRFLKREFNALKKQLKEDPGGAPNWQPLVRLTRTLSAGPFLKKINTQPKNLQAIDVQFAEKVFYTFQSDEEYEKETSLIQYETKE